MLTKKVKLFTGLLLLALLVVPFYKLVGAWQVPEYSDPSIEGLTNFSIENFRGLFTIEDYGQSEAEKAEHRKRYAECQQHLEEYERLGEAQPAYLTKFPECKQYVPLLLPLKQEKAAPVKLEKSQQVTGFRSEDLTGFTIEDLAMVTIEDYGQSAAEKAEHRKRYAECQRLMSQYNNGEKHNQRYLEKIEPCKLYGPVSWGEFLREGSLPSPLSAEEFEIQLRYGEIEMKRTLAIQHRVVKILSQRAGLQNQPAAVLGSRAGKLEAAWAVLKLLESTPSESFSEQEREDLEFFIAFYKRQLKDPALSKAVENRGAKKKPKLRVFERDSRSS